MYQIQYRYYGGSWIRDSTKYEYCGDAIEEMVQLLECNKKIEKIEVVENEC